MKHFLLKLILNKYQVKIGYLQIQYEDIEDHLLSRHQLKHIYLVLELHLFPCRFIIQRFCYESKILQYVEDVDITCISLS
jgi:hypothetical protein